MEEYSSTPLFTVGQEIADFLVSCGILSKAWEEADHAKNSESYSLNEYEGVAYVAFPSFHNIDAFIVNESKYGEGNIQTDNGVFSASLESNDEQPALVHQGALKLFLHILEYTDFQEKLHIYTNSIQRRLKPIIFVGHSLGGAVATLATLWVLEMRLRQSSPFCITFGCPLVGDANLVEAVGRENWAGNFLHVVSKHDIVPRMLLAPLKSIAQPLTAIFPYWHDKLAYSFIQDACKTLLENVRQCTCTLGGSDGLIERSPYKPFGTYMFCSRHGAACIDHSETVLKMLHWTMPSHEKLSDTIVQDWFSEHMAYGSVLKHVIENSIIGRRIVKSKSESSYEMGISLQLDAIGVGAQNDHTWTFFPIAGDFEKHLNKNVDKLAMELRFKQDAAAEIEWYKEGCEIEYGITYYDSMKNFGSSRDIAADSHRVKLAEFWDEVIEMWKSHELPSDFQSQNEWINAGTTYRRLVEPLDIAHYYRMCKGKGNYLSDGRPNRHKVLQKWMEAKEKTRSSRGQRSSTKPVSLTQNSCFWAYVEEAWKDLEKLKQGQHESLQNLEKFERDVTTMINTLSISPDVFLEGSSFMMWWKEWKEFKINQSPGWSSSLYNIMESESRFSFTVEDDVTAEGGASASSTVPSTSSASVTVSALTAEGGASASSTVPSTSSASVTVSALIKAVCEDARNVNLDDLIKHISELLEKKKLDKKGKKRRWDKNKRQTPNPLPTTSAGFSKLNEFLSKGIYCISPLKVKFPSQEAKKVAQGVINGIGQVHLVAAGFLLISIILERMESLSENEARRLILLEEMFELAKHIKELNARPQLRKAMEETNKEGTELIMEASLMCCYQIDRSKFNKFSSTSVDKSELVEFKDKLQRISTEIQLKINIFHVYATMDVKDTILEGSKVHPPKPRERPYPENAVGIEEPLKEVMELLDWESEESAVAVILHGIRGIGKSTLAEAVFAQDYIEGCRFSKVILDDETSTPDIVKLQKVIIKDLKIGEEIPDIRPFEEGEGEGILDLETTGDGRRQIGQLLEKYVAFVYIDNVSKPDSLQELLPSRNLGKAKKLRVLITTKDTNVLRGCSMKTKVYTMKRLNREQGLTLLKENIYNVTDDIKGQLDKIVDRCCGIPILLKIVAGSIRSEKDINTVMEGIKDWKGDTFGEIDINFGPIDCAQLRKRETELIRVQGGMFELEWYKMICHEKGDGYYDTFKSDISSTNAILRREELNKFWDEIIEMCESRELPHDFQSRNKWINAGTVYRKLVEPLDIAHYYRMSKGKGNYLSDGRPTRHKVLQKWLEGRKTNLSSRDQKTRTKLPYLTRDSCFWAHVEEALKDLKKGAWDQKFEGYVTEMINDRKISLDVFLERSSFMMWWQGDKQNQGYKQNQTAEWKLNSPLYKLMESEFWKHSKAFLQLSEK